VRGASLRKRDEEESALLIQQPAPPGGPRQMGKSFVRERIKSRSREGFSGSGDPKKEGKRERYQKITG